MSKPGLFPSELIAHSKPIKKSLVLLLYTFDLTVIISTVYMNLNFTTESQLNNLFELQRLLIRELYPILIGTNFHGGSI